MIYYRAKQRKSWKRLCGYGKKYVYIVECEGFQDTDLIIIQKLIETTSKGTNRRWPDRDTCFWSSARQWGRRQRRNRAGKQIDIIQCGRRFNYSNPLSTSS